MPAHIVNYGDDAPHCDFCGKGEHQVHRLIAGPGVNICDECVALCLEVLKERDKEGEPTAEDLPTPAEICRFLDSYVVGQAAAKQALAVAVYNHYKVIRNQVAALGAGTGLDSGRWHQAGVGGGAETDPAAGGVPATARPGSAPAVAADEVELAKSNVLLLGPTGTGKTYLARTLARMMKVPFAIVDATTLTEAGYVGDDVETILQRLLQAADGDKDKAEQGIIYVDEIDKIARKSGENTSITRDVSGEGVQQALLKILEGTLASVPLSGARKHQEQEMVQIDTKGILFICAGAFVGLDDIVAARLGRHTTGFGSNLETRTGEEKTADYLEQVVPQDLVNFGFLPEFVGRLPVVTSLRPLGVGDLERIITEPANALLKQYQKLFALDGVQLTFTPEAVSALAAIALEKETGARGLRALFESVLRQSMYELPDHPEVVEVVVDADVVRGQAQPAVRLREDQETTGRRRARA